MLMTDNIVFIAESQHYKYMNSHVCYDFIDGIKKNSTKYQISIFWNDEDPWYVHSKINELHPKLIIFFEVNSFHERSKQFEFVFSMNIPIYIFLDDTYYLNRITSKCEHVQKTNGIIFWYKHEKGIRSYKRLFPDKHITNVSSRFTNTRVFKNWDLEKKYDILLYGSRIYHYEYKREQNDAIQDYITMYDKHYNTVTTNDTKISFYPLRCKLLSILPRLQNKYSIHIVPEACYDSPVANEDLSKLINQSHLTITCSSIANVLLHKYLEIAASKSVILGDIPCDYTELFKDNIVEVNSFMSDDEIISIIDYYLSNKHLLLEKSSRLHDIIMKEHNLEKATEDFERVIDNIIK